MSDNIRRSTRLRIRENQAAEPSEEAELMGTSKRAHETDSEDDFNEKPRKKRAKTRTKNHQSKTVAPAKPRKRRGASLSMLVDQPLDIILTICKFTTPRDFVSLMQVCRAFYNLLSSDAITTWKNMRMEYEIPDPLPGMSEAEWAILLLGEPKCEDCGRRNKQHVLPIFMFKERLCGTCLRNRTLKGGDIYENRGEIFSIVPHMAVGSQRDNRYYSHEEVEKVNEELKTLESRDPAERVTYIVSGRLSRDKFNSLYSRALDWLYRYRRIEYDEMCDMKAKVIEERFLELGYCEKDAKQASKSRELRSPKELNDREWQLIKEKALDVMNERRVTLVARTPTSGIFAQRRELVRVAYTRFQGTLAPGKWVGVPPIDTICIFPEVLKILIVPDNVVRNPDDFANALESHRSTIEEWSDTLHVSGGVSHSGINDTVKEAFGPSFTDEYPVMLEPNYYSPSRHGKDCIKLAVYGFQCYRCRSMFTSLGVAIGHNGCSAQYASRERIPDQPWIEIKGPHYVHIQLLYLSGLKIAATTTDDLDNRGDFFKCLECAASPDLERQARAVATWRECVARHRHAEYNPDGVKFELVREKTEDDWKWWACAHCNIHVDALVTRKEVHEHLLNIHSISAPIVPGDFLYAGPY
ncbi:hypothetical protein VNI00_012276 [Paramarasmius palmivorus]|uniref:F-box domain-containing protein n=1 Tax=Paramarasmius palmivorus TaxID=297713 RepID=A0AAW0C7F1_9AGAR